MLTWRTATVCTWTLWWATINNVQKEHVQFAYSCIQEIPPAEQARQIGVSQATPTGLQVLGLVSTV